MSLPRSFLETVVMVFGVLIVLFSLSVDFFRPGSPGVGFEQLTGMVIGTMFILIGLRYRLLPRDSAVDILLLSLYLAGILVVGLKPHPVYGEFHTDFLGMNSLGGRDLMINVGGFVPLGFLMAAVMIPRLGDIKIPLLVFGIVGLGAAISLLIEFLQYQLVIGRHSSIVDLCTNILGSYLGVLAYQGFLLYRQRQYLRVLRE